MRYCFGQFVLDADARQLVRGGEEVHLPLKAFDLLTLLLANRERAMSKAELQETLWPGTFVEETNLAGIVAQVRRALGDSADTPAFIRTVYGFGYRFVGDVDPPRVPEAPAARARFFLVFAGREAPLLDGANVIGRAADVAVRIDTPGMSRRHAQITIAGGRALLEDLGSKNGTRLNGQQVTGPSELGDGDRIHLGEVLATFRIVTEVDETRTLTSLPR